MRPGVTVTTIILCDATSSDSNFLYALRAALAEIGGSQISVFKALIDFLHRFVVPGLVGSSPIIYLKRGSYF